MAYFADAHRDAPWLKDEAAGGPEWVRIELNQEQAKYLWEMGKRDNKGVIMEHADGDIVVWSASTSYGNRAMRPDPNSPTGYIHVEACRSAVCRHVLTYWQKKGLIRTYEGSAKGFTIIEKAARRLPSKATKEPKLVRPETFGLPASTPAVEQPAAQPEKTPEPTQTKADAELEEDQDNADEPDEAVKAARRPQAKAGPKRAPPVNVSPVIIQPQSSLSIHCLRPGGSLTVIKGVPAYMLNEGLQAVERLAFRDVPVPSAASKPAADFDVKARVQPKAVVQAILFAGEGKPASRLMILAHMIPEMGDPARRHPDESVQPPGQRHRWPRISQRSNAECPRRSGRRSHRDLGPGRWPLHCLPAR